RTLEIIERLCVWMSKERLEDAKEALKEIDFIKNQRDFKQEEIAKVYFTEKYGKFLIKQAERNLTAQETVEILGESLKQSIEQNKRYREALSLLNRVAAADYKSYIDTDANFVVDVTSEALEGEGE